MVGLSWCGLTRQVRTDMNMNEPMEIRKATMPRLIWLSYFSAAVALVIKQLAAVVQANQSVL